jgi:hypothetical protein
MRGARARTHSGALRSRMGTFPVGHSCAPYINYLGSRPLCQKLGKPSKQKNIPGHCNAEHARRATFEKLVTWCCTSRGPSMETHLGNGSDSSWGGPIGTLLSGMGCPATVGARHFVAKNAVLYEKPHFRPVVDP